MERTPSQQAIDLIERETNILVVLPKNPSTDAIASGLAFFQLLEKLEKRARVVANNFHLPADHRFLPKSKEIYSDLSSLQKFTITLNLEKTKAEELSYDIVGDRLNIYLTPKNGHFVPEDVSTSAGAYEHSLIVTLDTPELEALGELFDENAEFFYNVPVINIDHRAANTHFGQVNIVELTATSTSEIVFELIRELNASLLDEYIATNLLTGIISKTKSFQSSTVTPKSLAVASHLIASGARRDEIIRNLFQTKSLATLRLWGRVLAQLATDNQGRFVFSRASRKDFERAGASEETLPGVIDELIVSTPKAEIIAIFHENAGGEVRAIVSTVPTLNSLVLFRDLDPKSTRGAITLSFPGMNMVTAEARLRSLVRAHYEPTKPPSI
ncbi:MAG: hypothetical protein HY566_03000 [Candidatus Kerfeldbacteria bacterium]|nr:hypothetical protein [Candidatus Kerfeldbacteria bacterium]